MPQQTEPRQHPGIFYNSIAWLTTATIDYLNSTAIYISNSAPALVALFQQTLRFIFFPIYATASLLYVCFALMRLLLDRDQEKKIKKPNAVLLTINVISSALILTIVISNLVFGMPIGITMACLVGANLSLTGGYQFSCAAYYAYQARKKEKLVKSDKLSPEEKTHLLEEATKQRDLVKMHLTVGTTISLFALAGGLIFFTGILPFAGIGIVAALTGTALCAYGLQKEIKKQRHATEKHPHQAPQSTALSLRAFRAKPAPPILLKTLESKDPAPNTAISSTTIPAITHVSSYPQTSGFRNRSMISL